MTEQKTPDEVKYLINGLSEISSLYRERQKITGEIASKEKEIRPLLKEVMPDDSVIPEVNLLYEFKSALFDYAAARKEYRVEENFGVPLDPLNSSKEIPTHEIEEEENPESVIEDILKGFDD